MNDDYLWDGRGSPDPEIERLEKVLGRFRHNQPAPEFPARLGAAERAPRNFWIFRLAAAAAAGLILGGTWLLFRRAAPPPKPGPAWRVQRLEGSPRVGKLALGENGRLEVGEWLETDARSRAVVDVDGAGQVEAGPGTRLRLVQTSPDRQRMALERGTIHAMIWAPPGEFVVDTPSAVAVDLGCAYTLEVDGAGAGLLRVTFGWVGFTFKGRESFIPEGAVCETRPALGPGTPYFPEAAAKLRAALERLDFSGEAPAARALDLKAVLHSARRRDALTLWHLLARTAGPERAGVYDRLAALVPPPGGVTRQGVLSGDKAMLDLWWNQLGWGETSWWRMWERSWSAEGKTGSAP